MSFSFKDRYNNFLSKNKVLNEASEWLSQASINGTGNKLRLWRNLVLGSVFTLLMSFFSSVIGYNSAGYRVFMVIITVILTIIVNNIIFISFYRSISGGKLNSEDFSIYFSRIFMQLICSFSLMMIQSFGTRIIMIATSFSPKISTFLSIIIALMFTVMNFWSTILIFDGKTKLNKILKNSFNFILRNWKVLLLISVSFIVWSYAANVVIASFMYDKINSPQNINNIFHSLMYSNDFYHLKIASIFYLVHYSVAAWIEMKIFLVVSNMYLVKEY